MAANIRSAVPWHEYDTPADAAGTIDLREQEELARRPAGLQVVLGLPGLLEGIAAADPDVQSAGEDPAEHGLRPGQQLGAVRQ